MKRGQTGRWLPQELQSIPFRAFVPASLPPAPPLEWPAELREALVQAAEAAGRLDGMAALLPDAEIFLYSYVRKEAVYSSQIEGTQSSLSDLLMHEAHERPGVPLDDVQEVSNYVAASQAGLRWIEEHKPLDVTLIEELHRILLASGRGSQKDPGQIRSVQNWIGGRRPDSALFVPPPAAALHDCLDQWAAFTARREADFHPLVRAALAHAQFETIHPFRDGNGRVGRLLIPLVLCRSALLRKPLLYLSLYFRRNRLEYYERLQETREKGDWEAWLLFFLRGVHETAREAIALATRLQELVNQDAELIRRSGGKASGSLLEFHRYLQKSPVATIPRAHEALEGRLSRPTLHTAAETLKKLGILKELPPHGKRKIFVYERYVELMSDEDQ